ncbi:MAG: GNAT family N-acetyltransferase [Rhizobiales bacterium]|nr:GNAT family N-acetyltransferase [Hyphomicrobiales bacterium]
MLALPFSRRESLSLHGKRVTLRLPERGDYQEWARLRGNSRAFLEPWEPRWAPDELDRSGWRHRVSRYREDFAQGTAIPLLIFENIGGKLAGGITLGNIRYGVAQSGQIGYWIGESFAGKGMMLESVRLVLRHAFDTMRLHRVEAACIPDNARSIRVLEKAGFQREGLLRSYLLINGAWQDHYLYAIISTDVRGI